MWCLREGCGVLCICSSSSVSSLSGGDWTSCPWHGSSSLEYLKVDSYFLKPCIDILYPNTKKYVWKDSMNISVSSATMHLSVCWTENIWTDWTVQFFYLLLVSAPLSPSPSASSSNASNTILCLKNQTSYIFSLSVFVGQEHTFCWIWLTHLSNYHSLPHQDLA